MEKKIPKSLWLILALAIFGLGQNAFLVRDIGQQPDRIGDAGQLAIVDNHEKKVHDENTPPSRSITTTRSSQNQTNCTSGEACQKQKAANNPDGYSSQDKEENTTETINNDFDLVQSNRTNCTPGDEACSEQVVSNDDPENTLQEDVKGDRKDLDSSAGNHNNCTATPTRDDCPEVATLYDTPRDRNRTSEEKDSDRKVNSDSAASSSFVYLWNHTNCTMEETGLRFLGSGLQGHVFAVNLSCGEVREPVALKISTEAMEERNQTSPRTFISDEPETLEMKELLYNRLRENATDETVRNHFAVAIGTVEMSSALLDEAMRITNHATVDNPRDNIIKDWAEDTPLTGTVSVLAPGQDLERIIKRDKQVLSPETRRTIVRKVVYLYHFLYRRRLVHGHMRLRHVHFCPVTSRTTLIDLDEYLVLDQPEQELTQHVHKQEGAPYRSLPRKIGVPAFRYRFLVAQLWELLSLNANVCGHKNPFKTFEFNAAAPNTARYWDLFHSNEEREKAKLKESMERCGFDKPMEWYSGTLDDERTVEETYQALATWVGLENELDGFVGRTTLTNLTLAIQQPTKNRNRARDAQGDSTEDDIAKMVSSSGSLVKLVNGSICRIEEGSGTLQFLGSGWQGHVFAIDMRCDDTNVTERVALKISTEVVQAHQETSPRTFVSDDPKDYEMRELLYRRLRQNATDETVKSHFAVHLGTAHISSALLEQAMTVTNANTDKPNSKIVKDWYDNRPLLGSVSVLAPGRDLERIIKWDKEVLSPETRRAIVKNAVYMYDFLHQRHLVHGDLRLRHVHFSHATNRSIMIDFDNYVVLDMEGKALIDHVRKQEGTLYRKLAKKQGVETFRHRFLVAQLWELLSFLGNVCGHENPFESFEFNMVAPHMVRYWDSFYPKEKETKRSWKRSMRKCAFEKRMSWYKGTLDNETIVDETYRSLVAWVGLGTA